jgi:hypothetical protein
VFAHFGSVLFELIRIGTLSDEQLMASIDIEGDERVRQAYAKGHGVLIFSGHFGYWEMLAFALAMRVQPIAVMARPLDNPYLHGMLERIRTRSGNSVIYRQGRGSEGAPGVGRESRRGNAHRSASPYAGRCVCRFFQSTGRDNQCTGGAGAAHACSGHPRVRDAASRGSLPGRFRACGGAAILGFAGHGP